MSSQAHSHTDPFADEVTVRYSVAPNDSNVGSADTRTHVSSTGRGQRSTLAPSAPAADRHSENSVSQVFLTEVPSPSLRAWPTAADEMVPLHIMRQLVNEYAEFLGPAASPVVISEIVWLHFAPDRFPVSRLPHLADRLIRRLDTTRAVSQFVERLRSLHPALAHIHP